MKIPQGSFDGTNLINGKVRDILESDKELIITTSDRISAFDIVLDTIPCKGQVLNGMASYWFKETEDIIKNHIEKEISPRTIKVKKCEVLPVEVIVRGYLTGSAWRDYQAGKDISGIAVPAGMKMNQKFETPLLTPSTKAEKGEHDLPISSEEIVKTGLVEESIWNQVAEKSMALFNRGTELAASRGLILVDTKYEFGLLDGKVFLVDEIHTPDSSRFWYSETYLDLFNKGEKQKKVDKEFLRQWLIDQGFMGDGEAPVIPEEIKIEVAWKYIQAYELITGKTFVPYTATADQEIAAIKNNL